MKRPFHFVSAVSFATAVLSFLFRSQGMLQSSGGEIGKLIKAPQGRALESVSLRGQFQNPVNKQGLHKTPVLGIAGTDTSKDKLSPRAASHRMRVPQSPVAQLRAEGAQHPMGLLRHCCHCSVLAPRVWFERTWLFIPI